MEAFLVRSTYGGPDAAWTAARRVVSGGLGACAHVQEIKSCYRWQGEVVEESEWLLEVRTSTRMRDALMEALAARHPYDVPMVEAVPATVTAQYGAWLGDVTA